MSTEHGLAVINVGYRDLQSQVKQQPQPNICENVVDVVEMCCFLARPDFFCIDLGQEKSLGFFFSLAHLRELEN